MTLLCILLFYLNIYYSFAVSIDIKNSSSSVIIKEGETLEIFCTDFDNYKFFYPNNSKNILTSDTKISVKRLLGNVVGVLQRHRTVYGDTGWYSCIKSNVDNLNYKKPDFQIYVYVEASRNLFVSEKNSFDNLIGETFEDITIPCRPNYPNYTVQLFHNEYLIPDDKRVSYDPKKGFSINNLRISDVGYYSCKINHFDYDEEVSFFLTIISKNRKINKPIIHNKEYYKFITEGRDLIINCSVEVESSILYQLSWMTPRSENLEKYTRNDLGINYYQIVKELKVKNISYNDEGHYMCCLEYDNVKKCDQITVIVKDTGFEYLNITSRPLGIYYKNCDESITWIIDYDGFPLPVVEWVHPQYQSLQSHLNNNYQMYIGPGKVRLRIKLISQLDSGFHKMIISNRKQIIVMLFNLRVQCNK